MADSNSSQTVGNPNEQLQIPKWINEDYFQPILEADVPNFGRIKNFRPIAATAPGENYTSIMVRVLIDVELKNGDLETTSYILKTTFETSNDASTLLSSIQLFPKEKLMYQTILPNYVQLYKEAGVDMQLGPKCLLVEETPERTTLVFEDLKKRNFTNENRIKGLDMQHMSLVLKKLADLHAASAVYYELNGPYSDIFDKIFFNEENRAMFEHMHQKRLPIQKKAMAEWGLENSEYFTSKVPNVKKYYDMALKLTSPDPNEFNVLTHGDCWSNNIMFNYKEDGQTVDEVVFVDFQVSKWGSPALDLWYLIVSSASLDIKITEFDYFIKIYHDRLEECLKLLKYSKAIPTLKELHVIMLKYGFWGFFAASGVLSAVLLPSDKEATMENFLKEGPEGEQFLYKVLTNPYYVQVIKELYPFFDNKGIFDVSN